VFVEGMRAQGIIAGHFVIACQRVLVFVDIDFLGNRIIKIVIHDVLPRGGTNPNARPAKRVAQFVIDFERRGLAESGVSVDFGQFITRRDLIEKPDPALNRHDQREEQSDRSGGRGGYKARVVPPTHPEPQPQFDQRRGYLSD
jgi:hypothetical protein